MRILADMGSLVCIVFSSILTILVITNVSTGKTEGLMAKATQNLESIFKGRCWEYQSGLNVHQPPVRGVNCTTLWSKFYGAFAGKEQCNVSLESYQPFVEEAFVETPQDKSMLWSGIHEFVSEYSSHGKRYIDIANTFTGYITDGLVWCGNETSGGMEHNECPTENGCEFSALGAFWKQASIKYASNSKGEAKVMFNGTREKGFNESSIFAKYELPYLIPPRVTKLSVIIVNRLDQTPKQKCGEGSMLKLENRIREQGLEFSCEEYPVEILYYLCADNPTHMTCPKAGLSSGHRSVFSLSYLFIYMLLVITFISIS